ncbi:conjugal transfer protein TraG [Rodentibacter mrazii]|uniref:Conjugal transfer protein TraG n=1 Tax=Rodentibacter mrazii TaxID=1908257 RepID=A0A1V3IER9_9PAST|nr:conjugal transfer protein TraG N-terminal domain-containing protein [Rodentibacter mrazii]OOF39176.1 conjugal transfer protein TraG [Rodentibacter mrazii]
MTFSVDSYMEYFLTLLGWLLNNGVFALFVGTGVWLIPLVGMIFKVWRDVAKQGDDEGEKGDLLIRWLSLELIPAMFIVVLTLAPMFTISLNNIEYNERASIQCGYKVPSPEKSGYAPFATTFSNRQARMPIWWMFMHKIDKGFTYGMTAVLPCQRDLRQVRFEVQHQKITNPALLTEVEQFVQQCYVPARQKLQTSQVSLTPAQVRETSWLGGKLLISNSELYPRFRAQQPISTFPYDSTRDTALPDSGRGGFPSCDQWWDESNAGLKSRLLTDMRQNLSAQVSDFFNSVSNRDEALLRTLLRAENMDISKGKMYQGYGGSVDAGFWNAVTRLTSTVGTAVGSLAIFPGLDAMRQALPMVQAFMIMALIILIPIITILSGFSIKTVVTLSFVYFALVTTSFWWELARWLDSFMIEIMYSSPSHDMLNIHFLENAQDDIISNFVMGSLFIILPGLWFGAMTWAGINVGGTMSQALRQGSNQASTAGGKGAGIIESKLK